MSEQSVPLDANCMVCGLYKPCTRCTDIGWVCLNCQSSVGATPASEPRCKYCVDGMVYSQQEEPYPCSCSKGRKLAPSAAEPTLRKLATDIVSEVMEMDALLYCPAKIIKVQRLLTEALASSSERVRELEQELRYMFWAGHGHHGLYGDDGQMQCSQCRPSDYKNAPLNDVRETYRRARLELATKQVHEHEAAEARLELVRETLEQLPDMLQQLDGLIHAVAHGDSFNEHKFYNWIHLVVRPWLAALLVQLKKEGGE